MSRISETTIERIRTSADIIDVISSYIELKKRGRNFFGLCPFHDEKTPSFSVNPEKQIYKCFGCGSGGGVINFIMEIDSLDFIEAIKKLGQMYNIHIDIGDNNPKLKNLKSQLLEINLKTQDFYQEQLNSINGKKIKDYLSKRGFNSKIIEDFKLGFSDNKPSRLLKYIQKMNFSSDSMKKSGLFFENEKGYFDRFKSRLIFPINNQNGDIIAFAGRVIEKSDKIAKYINSPETPLYNKSKTFYGLDKASNTIKKENSVILVEGYFDLMQLVQNGIKNVIAISGTSFTDMHASIIKQYTSNIYIAFDGDAAGEKAAIRTGYTLLKNSIDSKIINIPKNYDPDDLIKQNGPEAFKVLLNDAVHTINFHHKFYTKNNGQSIKNYIDEAINEIVLIREPIFRELSAKRLSEITKVSEENILISLNNIINKREKFKSMQPHTDENKMNNIMLLEDDTIRLCLIKEKSIRKFIYENMNKYWLQSIIHKEIYNQLYIHLKSNQDVPINLIINQLSDNDIRSKIIDLTINIEKISPTMEMAKDCLIQLEKRFLKSELKELRNKLKNSNEANMLSIINTISKTENYIQGLDNKYS